MSRVPVARALVSVFDKTGLDEFVSRLKGVEIVSSGGTAAFLAAHGVAVTPVSLVTGAAEMLGGRVKTLHPKIHGAILGRIDRDDDRADLERSGIEPFQLVVVNLYPFAQAVARPEITAKEAIEQIDIGGPALIRAAAKNHAFVGVVTSPLQYEEVAAAVEGGGLDDGLRLELSKEAFFHTASYDAAIVAWLHRDEELPERMVVSMRRHTLLRYGENPHQVGALYEDTRRTAWWARGTLLQGKEMSFNNFLDAEAAWTLASSFSEPAAVVVKHTNPCGAALGASLEEAFREAWAGDPLAAFGGVVALNRPLDAATAAAIVEGFVEVLVVPAVDDLGPLPARPNLRVFVAPPPVGGQLDLRSLEGGALIQPSDEVSEEQWTFVSSRRPSPEELSDLRFAWVVAAATKSNAIVVARHQAAVGIGAGDQSRVGAVQRALVRAGDRSKGAVAASDAFFPFPDGIESLAAAGVIAVVAPGGSRRDNEVIAAADRLGLALVFAGRRHFRH